MKVITDFNVRQFNGLTGSPAKSVKRCRKNHESAWEKNTNIIVLVIMLMMMTTMMRMIMMMVAMMIRVLQGHIRPLKKRKVSDGVRVFSSCAPNQLGHAVTVPTLHLAV